MVKAGDCITTGMRSKSMIAGAGVGAKRFLNLVGGGGSQVGRFFSLLSIFIEH